MFDFIKTGPLPLAVVCLIIGFVFLVKGADMFVEGSSSIAKRFHVPSIIIGLTIVAIGTSLPEAAVSVTASITNNNALAISNVIGSNIFNLMVVIGMCALFTAVPVQKDVLRRDFPFSICCAILLLVLGYAGAMSLGRMDGIILLALYVCFMGMMIFIALKARKAGMESAAGEEEIEVMPVPKSILFIVIGAAGIAIGGDVVVNSAVNIATAFGMSQTLVGLTIVALGTSLPELVTSIVAARKNEVEMALGNAIGSNIANILLILGIASSISPIPFHMEDLIDICVLLVFSALVWVFAWSKKRIFRPEGLIMLVLYVGYVVYACVR